MKVSVMRRPISPSVRCAAGPGAAARPPVVVVALGGNALLQRGEAPTNENQQRNAREAAHSVARLVEEGFRVCLTHGNGPQVGLLALQDPASTLDVLGAETEGQLGYLLETELANCLPGGPLVVSLLTQTVVDPGDPAFKEPTKQIGKHYGKEEAERLAGEKGWSIAQDGDSWRRVVASPVPQRIVETRAIEVLLESGVLTICCGGGGVPVAEEGGRRFGVEAVVDKDAASSLLARTLGADWLVMAMDVEAVYDPGAWQAGRKEPVPSPTTPEALQGYGFAAGSMAPKVAAACEFVRATGGKAGMGSISELVEIVRGRRGTIVERGGGGGER